MMNRRHDEELSEDEPVEMPIEGELDLHTFRPKDVGSLVPEYLQVCRERNILEVRVIHGKGTGTLRQTVLSILSRLPYVVSYRQADPIAGGWGATIVRLLPPEDRGTEGRRDEGIGES